MQCSCGQTDSNSKISLQIKEKTDKHPCFSVEVHHKYARMHLPVAPKCNISCKYCNRKFDCLNESRPGVTSEILSPQQALEKFKLVKDNMEYLSVVGIAGPGDALANWQETKTAIQLIQAVDREIIFCLSTNGLKLPELAEEIVDLEVNHVTVTVNSLTPEIGAEIYNYINYKGERHTGLKAAQILIDNQLRGIELLAKKEVLVKVNIVMIEGINDHHIPAIVRKVKELGAFITNIMPLIPASGTQFETHRPTSTVKLNEMRRVCQEELQQMFHCQQCRADAIGLLGKDVANQFRQNKKAV